METIIPVLLLPEHLEPTETNLPLLKSIQAIVNDGYTNTYCQYPDYFGTAYVRLAGLEQLGDTVGEAGFTVVLLRARQDGDDASQVFEVVATGSVKDFGDGDIREYLQWGKSVSAGEWAARKAAGKRQGRLATQKRTSVRMQKAELTAFAVSPAAQSCGLGAKIIEVIDWVVSRSGALSVREFVNAHGDLALRGRVLRGSRPDTGSVQGIDVNQLQAAVQRSSGVSNGDVRDPASPKLVLIVIGEMGTEGYYQRRGFKTVYSGPVPVGKWDCRKACTMVYMEKGT